MAQNSEKVPSVVVVIPANYVGIRGAAQPAVKKRVAAYARVGTVEEDQMNRYKAQAKHYDRYVKSNPDHGGSADQ